MSTPVEIFAAAVQVNFDKISAGITSLDAQITAFQNSPGTLSASDQAALDKIQASSNLLATAATSTVTPVVPPVPASAKA